MSWFEISYFEDGHVITVLIFKAKSGKDARRKADALCPNAAHLSTRKVLRSGVRV